MTDLTLQQIDKIRALLASSIENGGIRSLDKDMVISALRDIYDEVLSMPVVSATLPTADESAAEEASSVEPATESDDIPTDTETPSEAKTEERDNRLADVTVPWAETSPVTPESPTEPTDTRTATEDETSVEKETEEVDAATVPETVHVDETDDAKKEEQEETVPEYNSKESTEETKDLPDDANDTETIEETVIVPETDDTDKEETHDPVEEITMSAEPILPEPTRLERMLSDDRSLAARLGRERLGAVADELCYGDMETCLDMIDALEATGDFDMAVLYIQEHYPQKSDSRAIDMLVEVLSAKFI